jgi:hypothetical protein
MIVCESRNFRDVKLSNHHEQQKQFWNWIADFSPGAHKYYNKHAVRGCRFECEKFFVQLKFVRSLTEVIYFPDLFHSSIARISIDEMRKPRHALPWVEPVIYNLPSPLSHRSRLTTRSASCHGTTGTHSAYRPQIVLAVLALRSFALQTFTLKRIRSAWPLIRAWTQSSKILSEQEGTRVNENGNKRIQCRRSIISHGVHQSLLGFFNSFMDYTLLMTADKKKRSSNRGCDT